ncbi:outer membrane protein [Aquabacterium sp.]|uniref:outer membrane protein n=1 Tax=Aquabacterium sp. TaxID=1872578 RepID=UPI0035B094AE
MMMKTLISVATTALFCVTAHANGERFYIQANAGSTSSDMSSCVSGRSGTTEIADCQIKGKAGKLLAGYRVMPHFALEASYWKYGTEHAEDSVGQVDAKLTAFGLGGALHFDISDDWAGVARFGFARIKTKTTTLDNGAASWVPFASDSHAKYYAGVGVSYAVTPMFRLHGDFDYSKVRSEVYAEHGLRMLSLGGSVNF